MATPRLLPLLLTALCVLASGCALPAAEAPTLPEGTALLVAWAPDRWAYVIDLPTGADALPEGLVVRVTETETGLTEDVPRDALAVLGNGSFEARPAMGVETGRTYVAEALVAGQSLLRREVRAVEDDVRTPHALDRELAYDARVRMTEDDDGTRMTMDVEGAMRLTAAEAGRTRQAFDGAGTVEVEDAEGMRMEMRARLVMVGVDDETTETLLTGTGRWTMAKDGMSGAGTVTMRQELVGSEDKADENGAFHRALKAATRMEMDGEIRANGVPASLHMLDEGHEWRRADTGDIIWRASNATTTVTVSGTPHEDEERTDEAVPYDEGKGDVFGAFAWDGPRPWPLVPGDAFEQASEAGLRVRYVVGGTEAGQALGRDATILVIRGDSTGEDASGTETWRVLAGGDLDGAIVSGTADYARGARTARLDVTLRPSD